MASMHSPPASPVASTAEEAVSSLHQAGDEVFRRLVESVKDYAIFLLTPEGVIASWNAGARRIKGYEAAEIVGKHFSVFYEAGAVASGWPAEELRRSLTTGHFEDEGWRIRKDGSRFWANAVISPIYADDGRHLGFSKVTRDLTERREHEQRLTDSERNLRLVVETVQDYAIFTLSPSGVVLSWNRGAQRIKGYAAQEIIGRHFSAFYTPADIERSWPEEELRRAVEDGRFEDEGWRVRQDGKTFWANVVITALRTESGELVGFSKVTRDLTERRRHEEELREREESLRVLVEGVRDHAMFLVDTEGRIRTWNAGAQRLLGYGAAQVLGQRTEMLYTSEDRNSGQFGIALERARAQGHVEFEAWRQKADGNRFLAAVTTTAVKSSDGEPIGFVQIIRDVTDKRRVAVLESEGKRISDFIAMLSHELRNPLAPIRTAASILTKFADKPETIWCAELIGRQVTHLTRLVDDLLDVSRITNGKIRLERRPVALNQVFEEAVESARPSVQKHSHVLTVALPDRALWADIDETRLTQVIVNLLTNSAKYTPAGGRIVATLRADDAADGHAVIEVSDTGLGMSPELVERAFDPFVQGDRALDRSEGGLGIGLTLVRSVVELHGGSVKASSVGPNMGTTMTVRLPLAARPAEVALAVATPQAVRQARVLVVDDNVDAAEATAMLLELSGHEVKIAFDAEQALRVVATFVPDVAFLDIGLPGMSGLELARLLRQMPALGGSRLVAMTGYGQDKDREASEKAGFDAHLTKPVDPVALHSLIAQTFSPAAAARNGGASPSSRAKGAAGYST
jgi:PAS domain S-box-containing protein